MAHDPTHEFSDDCEGCRPCIQNRKTGETLPDDHPEVIAMRKAFYEGCTLDERRAYHRAMFQGSMNPLDHQICNRVVQRMVDAIGGKFERWAKPGEVEALQEEFHRKRHHAKVMEELAEAMKELRRLKEEGND